MRCPMCGMNLPGCICGENTVEVDPGKKLSDLAQRILQLDIQFPLKGLFDALEKEVVNLELCAEMERVIKDLKSLM